MIVGLTVSCAAPSEPPGLRIGVVSQALAGYVQTATGISALSSSVSATFATTPVQGNLLVAIAGNPSTHTDVTTPSGWSVAIKNVTVAPGQVVFYKIAGAAESKTVTVGGFAALTVHGLQIFEWSGLEANNPPATATNSGSYTTGGTFTLTGVTTTAPGALVVAAVSATGLGLASDFSGWTNGFTGLNAFSALLSSSYAGGYLIAGAPGTYGTTISAALSGGSILGQVVAFNRRPTPVTELAVSAGATSNTVMFIAPAAPLSHVLVLAKTGNCTFSGDPVGTEAKGSSVGGGVVVLNDSPTSYVGATSVTLGGTTTVSYSAATGALTHSGLTAGTLYCYKAYARNGLALDDNSGSGRPSRSGTPHNGASGTPVFVFNAGSTSLSAPTVAPGSGAFYADNAGRVMAVSSAGIRRFPPYLLPDAVQNRGPVGTLSADLDATLLLDSIGGDAFAVWASGSSQGLLRWSTAAIDGDSAAMGDQALGAALYAAPLVSNALGRVFVATRNLSGAQNRLFVLNAASGVCVWVFNGTCGGTTGSSNLGQVSSVPILDPINYRLLVTSTQVSGGPTLWAIDAHDAPSSPVLWSRDIGASDSSPTFASTARNRVLVGTNAGRIYNLDPSTGASCWGSTSDGCGTATGTEQFFCASPSVNARASSCAGGSAIQKGMVALNGAYLGSFAFSTADGYVRLVNGAGVQQWRASVAGASAPLGLPNVGTGFVYVGGNDGLVRELALATGVQTGTRNVGGGAVVAGDPAYDETAGLLYVNTSQGNQYAFTVPF